MKRTLIVASIFLLLSVAAYAANDPGHDSLYVLKFGDSNIAGSINLTGSLNATLVRFTNRAFGDYLDINANGTILGAPSQPRIMAGANTLYVDSSGNLYINTKGGTSGIVQMGDVATNAITLNVSGTIKQQNVNVCLQDGTNCPASIGGATGYTHWRLGSNTGSIANVANNTLVNITAGSGITTTLSGTTITIANTGDTSGSDDVLTTTSHNNASTSDINVTGAYNALNLQIGPAKVGATELATSISLGGSQSIAYGSGTVNANQFMGQNSPYYLNITGISATNITSGTVTAARGGTGLASCSDNQVLKWNGGQWTCGTDTSGVGTESDPLWQGNASTIARAGTCAAGYVVQNTTNGGVQCIAISSGTVTGTGTSGNLSKWTGATSQGTSTIYDNGGNIGIGTATPGSILTVRKADATTGSVTDVLQLEHSSTGTTGNGFGTGMVYRVQNSSGAISDIGAIRTYQWGATGYMEFLTKPSTGVAMTKALSLDTGGLTIGDGSVNGGIAISGAAFGHLTNNAGAFYLSNAGNNYFAIQAHGSGDILFQTTTSDTERMRIRNSGNIGIGTASPAQKLEVNGSIKITNDAAATGLYLGRADNVHEGGELSLAGAANYPNWTQDSYDTQLRFFTSYASNVTVWMNNVGAGSLNLDVQGTIYSGGSQVCTAANGICATGSSTAAGWTNTTTQTTTTLNVGIGSSGAPNVPLEVYHGGASTYGNVIRLNQNAIGNSDGPKVGFYKTMTSSKGWTAGIINGADAGDFIINEDGGITGFGTTRFRIAPGGNIGIGTTGAPTQKLEVSGNLNVSGSGNIYYAGNLTGYGADLAEFIAGEEVSAGDVVIFSETKDTTVLKSTTKYDTRVAGIISTRPSHIMGAGEGNAMLALAGRVPVKVTTEGGPVRRGDLLTTSSTPGHAMRCDDRAKCAGALVGKATESFDGTKGTITALVMLG